MTSTGTDDPIFRWMQSADARRSLAHAAKVLHQRMKIAGIPLSVIDLPEGAAAEDVVDHLASELKLYILENRSAICSQLAPPEADRPLILVRAMLRHLLDRARSSPEHSPWRYLYKRAADVFRSSPDIHTRKKGQTGTLFGMSDQGSEIGRLAAEDYADIALPDELAHISNLESVVDKEVLVALAGEFWKAISGRFGGQSVWIELRDLIHWIGRFVPLKTAAAENLDDADISIGARDEATFDADLVRQWAGLLANRLTEKQMLACHYRYCQGLNLDQTAARMGLKGASGADYHLGQFSLRVRAFTADLPWLSPDGGDAANPAAREYFMEVLCGLLKNSTAEP